jgi:predicted AAA+ superfamily ATPase
MSIRPWRDIAIPHQDVLKGTFQQSEFAADISQVQQGKAPPEYQDARQFFARTYITEGMRLLLDKVMRRLAGQAGDPVIQLQTAFGGGKTHTLMAVYHIAERDCPISELAGVPPILDAAGINDLPKANVAVLDGINLSPSSPKEHGAVRTHTLWGELAWQLGSSDGYAMVRAADEAATSPDKDQVIALLSAFAPCVILMDELVAFYRQFDEGQRYPAGTFETNMTFIQALTEGIRSVPGAILLASLPDSRNAGEGRGQAVLAQLESYFRRIHAIWKPVTKDEAFSIVRRRLFERIDDRLAMEDACRAFAELYRTNGSELPPETQENYYLERMQQAYPIHPEIFDRLYEDWSTLSNFQRTRGVLQLLAQVVHRLWKDGNADGMILPGALPLNDPGVRNKCLDYLPQGWDPVIDQDIDGEHARPAFIESKEPLIGKIQGARRLARTIFLGSAPGAGRSAPGLPLDHLLLGVVQPGQTLGHYKDALRRLRDQLNYLNAEGNRYWFDTRPNLRREMESRRQRFSMKDDIEPLLRERVQRVFGKEHVFDGIHVFTPSADIPDDYGTGPRLVVLPPAAPYRKGKDNPAERAAEEVLTKRGEQPRQKQNRLLFLAADADALERLKDQARTYLAWVSIVTDVEAMRLNLDQLQAKQAKDEREESGKALLRTVRDTFRWLLSPVQEVRKGRLDPTILWEAVQVSAAAQNLAQEIQNKLRDNGWLITQWSPIHLANILDTWYCKDGTTEVGALKVWQDTCHYLYLPRLTNSLVFQDAVRAGIETEDFFGFAGGKQGDKYLGFAFGRVTNPVLDEAALLIDREAASVYARPQEPDVDTGRAGGGAGSTTGAGTGPGGATGPGAGTKTGGGNGQTTGGGVGPQTSATHFYATSNLDPIKAKLHFAQIVDEVVQHFTTKSSATVTISVEIRAEDATGFDDSIQRAVRENCTVLKFSSAEFEGDQ